MSALTEFKAMMIPGRVVDVTNHYIDRPDHSCYGTTRRTVEKVNGASWYQKGQRWPNKWPRAAHITRDGDKFLITGHPSPEALFLTIVPVEEP